MGGRAGAGRIECFGRRGSKCMEAGRNWVGRNQPPFYPLKYNFSLVSFISLHIHNHIIIYHRLLILIQPPILGNVLPSREWPEINVNLEKPL